MQNTQSAPMAQYNESLPTCDSQQPLSLLPPECREYTEAGPTSQLAAYYQPTTRTVWLMMHCRGRRPSFNPDLLRDVEAVFHAIKRPDGPPVDFFVSGSTVPKMYNAGGDLHLFVTAIRNQDRACLLDYATRCINIVTTLATGFNKDVITIAMVDGSALGGGFEAALAHQYLFAQHAAPLALPEIAFNLFPGMGAYSLICRKVNRRLAENLISTGAAHPAHWHHEQGLVDQLFDSGHGPLTVSKFITSIQPKLNGIRMMLRARNHAQPLRVEELLDITSDWVDAALQLKEKDLAYIDRLVEMQSRRAMPRETA